MKPLLGTLREDVQGGGLGSLETDVSHVQLRLALATVRRRMAEIADDVRWAEELARKVRAA